MNIFYTLFPTVINMSITASVATVVIVVLRKIFKDMPKIIFYAMWLIVLFRLLCPISIPSDFSVLNALDMPSFSTGHATNRMEYVPVDIVHTEYPEVDLPVPLVSDIVNYILPQGDEQLRADPLEAPVAFATDVWLIGIAAMFIYGDYSFFKLRKRLKEAVKISDNIYLCDHIASPFVIGIVKPKIYLPSSLAESEQKYIILHEQHHIKRFDHIVKLVAFAALSIHWFNPFVWIAFTLLCKDMEMSCDEAVIAKLGLEIRSDYSRSLLNLSTGKHIFAGMPLAFGEGDTGSRIKNLYNYRKPKAAVFVAVAAVCAILGVTLLLNPDNSGGQIYYNGTVYVQSGKAQSGGVVGSKNIGEISSVIADTADFSENFSAKNIDEINRGMPVLQFEDDPYTLWLTTGKGWIPFTAKGMSYQTSDSWVKVSSVEGKADVVFEVDENVNEIAFYEDIYEYGELISSSLVSYANTNDNAPFERKHHNQFSIGYTFDSNKLTVYDIYVDTGVMVTMYAILPKDNYKGYSYGEVSTDGKKPLLANDSVDVAYAILSSYDDARIYSDYTSKNNDTVVVYRLVTRSNPTR